MSDNLDSTKWYSGISRYQWLVLFIASLGWVFDVFEGQIFVASMKEAMPSLTGLPSDHSLINYYNSVANSAYLAGGALGGIFFGMLSDRIGRKRTMAITIVFYSLFTFLSAFSFAWWHLAALRFLVAIGVGGEWAVASSMVAEVFPKKARANVGSIFHASSVLGTYLAIAAGVVLIGNPAMHQWAASLDLGSLGQFIDAETLPWRMGFALGALPAFLIIWIRLSLKEPESWVEAQKRAATNSDQQMGRIGDLFKGPLLRHTLVGLGLATFGLATFWQVHIHGKNILHDAVQTNIIQEAKQLDPAFDLEGSELVLEDNSALLKRWEMLGMFLATTGGGIGLVCFGTIAQKLGRRKAFLFYYVGAFFISCFCFGYLPGTQNTTMIMFALPVFGFLTLGMHAGYAVYFPELYPTRLRGTGSGMCFNGARLLATPIVFLVGMAQADLPWMAANSEIIVSFLFLAGAAVLIFAPETRDQELPE